MKNNLPLTIILAFSACLLVSSNAHSTAAACAALVAAGGATPPVLVAGGTCFMVVATQSEGTRKYLNDGNQNTFSLREISKEEFADLAGSEKERLEGSVNLWNTNLEQLKASLSDLAAKNGQDQPIPVIEVIKNANLAQDISTELLWMVGLMTANSQKSE